jgi:hypothetical protein
MGVIMLPGSQREEIKYCVPGICPGIWRNLVTGIHKALGNGVILYNRAGCEDHMENISLCMFIPSD